MLKTKVSSNLDISKRTQNKTDWKKIYNKTQSEADREAAQDKENPVLKNVRFKKLNNDNQLNGN